MDLRLPRAELLIWIERPRLACIVRVLQRAIRSHFRADEDLAPGCKERFDSRLLDRLRYTARFDRVNRPKIESARLQYGPPAPVMVLRSGPGISSFLAACDRHGQERPL